MIEGEVISLEEHPQIKLLGFPKGKFD